MKRLLIVTAIAVTLSLQAQGHELEGDLEPFLGDPVIETQQIVRHKGSQVWPNVVAALDGTILATYGVAFGGGEPFADNRRHVAVRRSEDGGRTWGEEIIIAAPGFQGGGTLVDETSGHVLAFVEEKHPPATLTIYRVLRQMCLMDSCLNLSHA